MTGDAPEYLPMPTGFGQRAAALEAAGVDTARAYWMAACEASGAIGRRESNHRDLFWFGEASDEQRESWDRIADREGKRFYFHQKLDTLVGYLAHGRHEARLNAEIGTKRQERLRAFLRENGLWGRLGRHAARYPGAVPHHPVVISPVQPACGGCGTTDLTFVHAAAAGSWGACCAAAARTASPPGCTAHSDQLPPRGRT